MTMNTTCVLLITRNTICETLICHKAAAGDKLLDNNNYSLGPVMDTIKKITAKTDNMLFRLRIFKASALWADAFYKSFVRLSVCVFVHF